MPVPSDTDAVRSLRRFEWRVLLGALLMAAPLLLALVVLALMPLHPLVRVLVACVAVLLAVALARLLGRRLVRPLQTLAIQVEALREGDYTLRGVARGELAPVVGDLNALAGELQHERLRFEEASHLLAKTLAALDSAVFVFGGGGRLDLVNPAGQRLLGKPAQPLFGRTPAQLGLQTMLEADSGSVLAHGFPARTGRFEVRHARLRQEGRDGCVLVLNDVDRVLRSEERQAWQRLLRVLGHEVNNSLAPIQSIAGTLAVLLQREPLPEDWRADMGEGLGLIARRTDALARFLSSYSRLARLPPPQRRSTDLAVLVRNVARLQQEAGVVVEDGPALPVKADADQIEQALINLLRNAVEAQAGCAGDVHVRWRIKDSCAVVEILDQGPGPPPSANLFVPFFTTKPGGSGIGLVLARQVAEAHGGGVTLVARAGGAGALARLWIEAAAS